MGNITFKIRCLYCTSILIHKSNINGTLNIQDFKLLSLYNHKQVQYQTWPNACHLKRGLENTNVKTYGSMWGHEVLRDVAITTRDTD